MKKFIFLVFITLIVSGNIFAQNDFGFMQLLTPKDYFASGNISYYYGNDGGFEFWFDNASLVINDFLDINKPYNNAPSLKKFLSNAKEVLYLNDGTVVIYRTNDEWWNR